MLAEGKRLTGFYEIGVQQGRQLFSRIKGMPCRLECFGSIFSDKTEQDGTPPGMPADGFRS